MEKVSGYMLLRKSVLKLIYILETVHFFVEGKSEYVA